MAGNWIQQAFQDADFDPVPSGHGHYVAAIQNKAGELTALRNASPETWSRLTPLIQVVGPKRRTDPYKRDTVVGWLRRVANAVGQRPCFLDIIRLRPGHATTTSTGTQPVLSVIHEAARARGMNFVPVLPIADPQSGDYLGLVSDSVASDGRGAALRYPVLRVALEPDESHANVLTDALRRLGIEVTSADVLVDLGYLSGDEELYPEDVGQALKEVIAVGAWRSVVLLGTSMPSMLGGTVDEGTIGELPRREWELWSALRQDALERVPTYGDYVIQHPNPPRDEDGGGPGMRANIRYTTEGKTLVARARGPLIQEGREQYRSLCQQLVARPEFAGPDFSWGDSVISACARGEIEPGSQNQWRGAGSSHHFRLVSQQLSS